MKTKNILQHKLIILLCLFTSFAHAGLSDLIHNDPWKFMRDKFITAPNTRASAALPTIAKCMVGLGVGIGTGIGANNAYKRFVRIKNGDEGLYTDFQNAMSSIGYYSSVPAAIAAGCLAYYKLHTTLVAHYQREQLIDLLNNWPQIKSRMPSDLQSGFEEINKEYKAHPRDFAYKADDIIRVITEQINEKFEDKTYRKFWDAKILTGNIILDIGNTIASFANIFKK